MLAYGWFKAKVQHYAGHQQRCGDTDGRRPGLRLVALQSLHLSCQPTAENVSLHVCPCRVRGCSTVRCQATPWRWLLPATPTPTARHSQPPAAAAAASRPLLAPQPTQRVPSPTSRVEGCPPFASLSKPIKTCKISIFCQRRASETLKQSS